MANTLFNQTSSNIKVNIGQSGGVVGSTLGNNAVTLTSQNIGKSRLTDLTDVSDAVEVDGGTLVYNASTDEYELKALNIDGGTF
jgi:hypothetical protein|tara:strand:+ start:446 stop:697 length:252 start_codon:yes stop_codon:yes gene_type:complete